jgi:hypothetical protein
MIVAAMIGPDAEQLGGCRLRGGDCRGDAALGVAQPGIDAAEVGDQLEGKLVSGRGHRPGGFDLVEQSGGLTCADLTGEVAGDQLAQYGVQPTSQPSAVPGQVTVTPRPLARSCAPDCSNRRWLTEMEAIAAAA